MKSFALILPIALLWSLLHFAPLALLGRHPSTPAHWTRSLKKMDTAAASFRTTHADFEWDFYEKVIDEVDNVQTGTIYYRRSGKEIEMMADVKTEGSDLKSLKPEPKYVLFNHGKIRVYQPKPDQVTEIDLSKDRSDRKLSGSWLWRQRTGSAQILRRDLCRSGDIAGVATAKLQLVPKSEKVRNTYHRIFLWIDLESGISVQQQFFSRKRITAWPSTPTSRQ